MQEDPLYYHPFFDPQLGYHGRAHLNSFDCSSDSFSIGVRPESTTEVDDDEEERWVPEYLQCPISSDIMVDPVIDEDGHSYERANILKWLEDHTTSPVTRRTMFRDELRTNSTLASVCEAFRRYQPISSLLTCPLTEEIMQDPVVHDDGRSYERTLLCQRQKGRRRLYENVFFGRRRPLQVEYGYGSSVALRPNRALKNAIAEFLKGEEHNGESAFV